jgi:hypothetical protein
MTGKIPFAVFRVWHIGFFHAYEHVVPLFIGHPDHHDVDCNKRTGKSHDTEE